MNDVTRISIRNGIEDVFGQWVEAELAPWESDDDSDKETLIEALTALHDALDDYVNNLD